MLIRKDSNFCFTALWQTNANSYPRIRSSSFLPWGDVQQSTRRTTAAPHPSSHRFSSTTKMGRWAVGVLVFCSPLRRRKEKGGGGEKGHSAALLSPPPSSSSSLLLSPPAPHTEKAGRGMWFPSPFISPGLPSPSFHELVAFRAPIPPALLAPSGTLSCSPFPPAHLPRRRTEDVFQIGEFFFHEFHQNIVVIDWWCFLMNANLLFLVCLCGWFFGRLRFLPKMGVSMIRHSSLLSESWPFRMVHFGLRS